MLIQGSATGQIIRGTSTGAAVRSPNGAELLLGAYYAAPGTLAGDAIVAVDGAINGVTADATALNLYAVASDPTYTRNPSHWGAAFDLTCISATETNPGTLISPRHVMGANHFQPSPTLRFVAADGTVATRTVTAGMQIGPTDAWVGVLDSDVPAGITFARMLPADYRTKLPAQFRVPVATTNQARELRIHEWYVAGPDLFITSATHRQRPPFYTQAIAGDSGNPWLLLLAGQTLPVILSHFYGSNEGPSYAANLAGIAAAMVTLGGGYTAPTQIDLSSYPDA